jgi:LemA protein
MKAACIVRAAARRGKPRATRLSALQKSLRPVMQNCSHLIFCCDNLPAVRFNPPNIMSILIIVLIVLGVIALGLVFWVIGAYNGLVTLRNRFKNAFAQIDVQLKRRYDLIPNLVETAKGYLKHERETLEAVIQARNVAASAAKAAAANPADAAAMKGLGGAESGLAGALSRLMMVVEQYPDLKANQNMMQLTEELTSTENKISFSRQAYNDSVMTFNTRREVFPTNLIAGMFNFAAAELFQIENAAEREAPKVKFT